MQANYGGIRVDLPKSLQNIFNEGEEEDKEEESQVEEGAESQIEEGEELPSQDAGEDSEPMEGGGGGTMEASGSLDETWGDMSIHTTRGEEEEEGEGEGRSSMELQMNWNICTYLPEAGSCQNAFQVYIYIYIYIHTVVLVLVLAYNIMYGMHVFIYMIHAG